MHPSVKCVRVLIREGGERLKASQKQEEFTQLYSDVLFKIMFGTERNKMFAQDFLESYLNLEQGSLKGLKILNSFSLDKETIMPNRY